MKLGISNFFFIYFLIVYNVALCVKETKLYDILGVGPTATTNAIKKAFRTKAKDIHPDHSDDPRSSEKFQELSRAYKILIDPEKREKYDQFGEEGIDKMGFSDPFDGHDPFTSFFGDFFGNFDRKKRDADVPRGADVVVDLYVTLEEIYKGDFVKIKRKKLVYKKTSGTRKCNCRLGMETRQVQNNRFEMYQVQICDDCPNVKLVSEIKNFEVEVEVGAENGHEIRFTGEGEPHIEGEQGDLIFKLKVLKHKFFQRRGDDLFVNVTISLQQALNGFEMDIEHLDGHIVHITRKKITWPGAKISKKNEGMVSFNNNMIKGTLFITFDVYFPRKELSDGEKDTVAKLLKQDNFLIKTYNGL